MSQPLEVTVFNSTDGVDKAVLIWARKGDWGISQMAHSGLFDPELSDDWLHLPKLDEKYLSWVGEGPLFGLAAPIYPRPAKDEVLSEALELAQDFTAEELTKEVLWARQWRDEDFTGKFSIEQFRILSARKKAK